MRRKKITGIFLLAFLLGILGGSRVYAAEAPAKIQNPVKAGEETLWNSVYFGSYYTDETTSQKQPIKWRVLSVKGQDAFLLSEEILDAGPYHDVSETVTWKDSSLRAWLNGSFYNSAFSQEEKKAILKTTVVTKSNPDYDTPGGEAVQDLVYLLSADEAVNPAYGFFASGNACNGRKAKNTGYAAAGGSTGEGMRAAGRNDWWWLRTKGFDEYSAAQVMEGGYLANYGSAVEYRKCGIRPVLHLNLAKTSVWSYAGTVNEDGEEAVLDNMKISKKKTRYQAGEKLSLEDLSVTAKYGEYTIPIGGYTTNAASINMAKAGTKTLIVTCTMNGEIKTGKLELKVEKAPVLAPAKVKLKSLKKSGKKLVIKWKKTSCSGYQVLVSTNAKFKKNNKKFLVKSPGKITKKVKAWKGKKTYYVKVRAYRKSGKNKIYGPYSKRLKIKYTNSRKNKKK